MECTACPGPASSVFLQVAPAGRRRPDQLGQALLSQARQCPRELVLVPWRYPGPSSRAGPRVRRAPATAGQSPAAGGPPRRGHGGPPDGGGTRTANGGVVHGFHGSPASSGASSLSTIRSSSSFASASAALARYTGRLALSEQRGEQRLACLPRRWLRPVQDLPWRRPRYQQRQFELRPPGQQGGRIQARFRGRLPGRRPHHLHPESPGAPPWPIATSRKLTASVPVARRPFPRASHPGRRGRCRHWPLAPGSGTSRARVRVPERVPHPDASRATAVRPSAR